MIEAGDARPLLCVIVDTEEEFDWSRPLARENRSVRAIAAQHRAHEIFTRYGIVPTYVVDHPVATDGQAVAVLKGLQDEGRALIGAHLHPWVNPPFEEEVCPHNSYPGNLPPTLEAAKLRLLTATIEEAFGRRPRIYKAGRYGIGPATPALLRELGYLLDVSVVPYTEFTADGGPDFRDRDPFPAPLTEDGEVLELPLTVGFSGLFAHAGPKVYPLLASAAGVRLRLPGMLARLRLLERSRLSPEGASAEEHIRLTRALLRRGVRVFSYTYHSPSLAPGHTPYVRTERDLARFLDEMDRYFETFFGHFGGRAATPLEIYDSWRGVPADSLSLSRSARSTSSPSRR